jgi:hypothetical protein
MSIYDQRTRAGNLRNPAKALYAHWHSILKYHWNTNADGRPTGAIQFGRDRSYGIGPYAVYDNKYPESEIGSNTYPHIAFGHAGWGYGSVGNDIILTRDGEFRLRGFHGYESRNRLARNTFLDWDYHRSSYQWFVNVGDQAPKNYHGDSNLLKAWRNPVHYVKERLLTPEYLVKPYWVKLERDTGVVGGWKIVFSRMADIENSRYRIDVDIPKRFADYEDLRLRRLAKTRDQELIDSGELIQTGSRTWKSKAEIETRKEEQALALAAHLDVRMPAKTNPLKPLRRR